MYVAFLLWGWSQSPHDSSYSLCGGSDQKLLWYDFGEPYCADLFGFLLPDFSPFVSTGPSCSFLSCPVWNTCTFFCSNVFAHSTIVIQRSQQTKINESSHIMVWQVSIIFQQEILFWGGDTFKSAQHIREWALLPSIIVNTDMYLQSLRCKSMNDHVIHEHVWHAIRDWVEVL